MAHCQKIKTNIKFKQNEKGAFYGFVTKNEKGSWRGCREESGAKKKIVIVDRNDSKRMIPNALYQVFLVPMESAQGFIAVDPTLLQFPAKIETEVGDNTYRVKVKFGHKEIIYDPSSSDRRLNDIQYIVNLLRNRYDLERMGAVIDEFVDCACLLLSIYKRKKHIR